MADGDGPPWRDRAPDRDSPGNDSKKHKHIWQWSIHDAVEWCECGESRPTLTEQEMEAGAIEVPAREHPLPPPGIPRRK